MFWIAIVAGRLLVSALLLHVSASVLWRALPLLMILAFYLLPGVRTGPEAVAAFGFAGLACSAFFPLTIALAAERFPQAVAQVSSLLIAALMLGVGLGSFLIGGLRALSPLEDLYLQSIVFPLGAMVAGYLALRTRCSFDRAHAGAP
jgi:predicted MFS family arabinose efflux permease